MVIMRTTYNALDDNLSDSGNFSCHVFRLHTIRCTLPTTPPSLSFVGSGSLKSNFATEGRLSLGARIALQVIMFYQLVLPEYVVGLKYTDTTTDVLISQTVALFHVNVNTLVGFSFSCHQ